MGFGGISIWQLLIILAIVVLLFGTKRLGNIGTDLGKAIKGFKNSVKEDDPEEPDAKSEEGDRKVEDKTEAAEASAQQEKTQAEDTTRS